MKSPFSNHNTNKSTTIVTFIVLANFSSAATLADAQKEYVAGNWKKAADAYEQVCPNQPAEARTECYLWNVLALSQTGIANDFAKAGKRLDSLIEKTNPQKKVYADLVMTRAQFQLYLGKLDNAAEALVHAIETSQPSHAVVLQKVCDAVQAKVTKPNLAEACDNLKNGSVKKQEQTTAQPVPQPAVQDVPEKKQATPTKPAATIDLPDFDSDPTPSKDAAPAGAVQAKQNETWVLQLGAFSMKPNAETLVNNLRKRKIQCNLVEILQDSRTLYLVQTVGFESKEKAIDYGAQELSPLNIEFRAILKK